MAVWRGGAHAMRPRLISREDEGVADWQCAHGRGRRDRPRKAEGSILRRRWVEGLEALSGYLGLQCVL